MLGRANHGITTTLPAPMVVTLRFIHARLIGSGAPAALEIARQLGLELTPAERPVDMLVVRKRQ